LAPDFSPAEWLSSFIIEGEEEVKMKTEAFKWNEQRYS
jgi:hypothetical protein